MTCIRRNLDTQNCCNQWQKGIRTINQTYPDDNREFEIRAGAGITIVPITAGILITNSTNVASSFIEGTNIEFTPSGDQIIIGVVDGPTFADDTTINADLIVNGDIIQRGAAYETHAEKIYTTNDYVIMRDGAVGGLAAGDYSGFQVKLYDGVNDGRLVIDNTGTARVGDVGDEEPLLTRDEAADLTDGDSLIWDAANSKAITAAIPSAINTALAGKQNSLTVETFSMTAYSTNVNIFMQNCWAYGKLVHIDADIRYTANISTSEQLTTIPSAYLPANNIPITINTVGSSPNIHPGGIGWGRNGIFTDTPITSSDQTRVSITYYRN